MSPTPETPRGTRGRPPARRTLSPVWFALGLFVLLLAFQITSAVLREGTELDYSDFKTQVGQGRMSEVIIGPDTIHGKYLDANNREVPFTTNKLDDHFDASPALVDREIYLRGMKYLYSIGH